MYIYIYIHSEEPGLATSAGFFQVMFHARHALRTKPAADPKLFPEQLETCRKKTREINKKQTSTITKLRKTKPLQPRPTQLSLPPKKVIIIGPVNGLPSAGGSSKNHRPPGKVHRPGPGGVLCTCQWPAISTICCGIPLKLGWTLGCSVECTRLLAFSAAEEHSKSLGGKVTPREPMKM